MQDSTSDNTDLKKHLAIVQAFSRYNGLQRDLLTQVITKLPFKRFCLKDVYERARVFQSEHADIQEFEADIRASMQQFRNKGMILFHGNGQYEVSDELWMLMGAPT